MVQVTGSKWEEVEGEADVNEVYLVVMWPQSPCSCLAWQLREIFIFMLLLREGVTERGCLVWAQKHPTPSRPRGLSWLSALWGMLCALQSRRILPVLKVIAQHEVTPALIHTWIPCWAHRGGTTEAFWMSGGVKKWSSTVREGTHFNQPASDGGGTVCESRAPTWTPGQWEEIPPAQAGPTGSGKERTFSSKRTPELPSAPELEEPFYPSQLSLLRKGSTVVQELPVSLTHWWLCVLIQGCQASHVPERRDLHKSRDLTSH